MAEVVKDESRQRPIPTEWRSTIGSIVSRLLLDERSAMSLPHLCVVCSEQRARIANSIADYGARLVELPEECWASSVCQWMGGYWDALVDLFTEEEGRSDLVLSLHVREGGGEYLFEVMSVHVP